jgi:hypothetical protein
MLPPVFAVVTAVRGDAELHDGVDGPCTASMCQDEVVEDTSSEGAVQDGD